MEPESSGSSGQVDYRILGLDVGIASVGAAVLNLGQEMIEGLYVRAFDKAEVAKTGESLNAVRREARGVRRRLRRRRLRLADTLTTLVESSQGELPTSLGPAQLPTDPWEIRARGLDSALAPLEFAAAIYHLQKYRGFQTNRRNASETDDDGKMKAGISETERRLAEADARTVGELALTHPDYRTQKRNRRGDYSRTVDRRHTASEMSALFAAQRRLSPSTPLFSMDSEKRQLALINRRRPFANADDIRKMIGSCTLESGELRAPRACHSVERFVWLQKLNSIRILSRGDSRPLDEDQLAALREFPFEKAKITFAQVRKVLELDESERINLCRYREEIDKAEKATLFEAKAFHTIRRALADLESSFDELVRNDHLDPVGETLTVCQTEQEVQTELAQLGLENDVIGALSSLSFAGFGSLSLKAVRAILPHLERGLRYDQAAAEAGYDHSQRPDKPSTDRLPMIDRDDIRNPVVARGMRQAIKVINAVLKKHGPVHAVHIELARDVGKPRSERNSIEREQANYQKNKDDARKQFQDTFGKEPSGLELQKFVLYREQDGQCAYSGTPLEINRLFEVGYTQVDHILPFSRTFDDSQANKVLVAGIENQRKGNRTPFEYLGSDSETGKWDEFRARVQANPKIRFAKKNRLLAERLQPTSEFIDRNLNDTRYFARLLKNHIEAHLRLAPSPEPDRRSGVVSVTGRATGFLRHRWGLHKDRARGDRHHAMDAAVIAATTRGMIKRVTDYSKRQELRYMQDDLVDAETGEVLDMEALRQVEAQFPLPYPDFRDELLARLSDNPGERLRQLKGTKIPQGDIDSVRPMIVSRPVMRRGTGEAHEATVRRMIQNPEPWVEAGQTSKKVPLTEINLKKLEQASGYGDPREETLHEAIKKRLDDFGDDPKKAFAEDRPLYRPTKSGKQGPKVRGLRIIERHPSGLVLPKKGGMADNGSMVRVDIYRVEGKFVGAPIYVHSLTSQKTTARYCKKGIAFPNWPEVPEDTPKVMSLYKNSFVRIQKKNGDRIQGYYVGFDIRNGAIDLRYHDNDQTKGPNGLIRGLGIATLKSLEVWGVDLLGNLYPPRNE
jgi:CRISPR-associated endonuclease Csn1